MLNTRVYPGASASFVAPSRGHNGGRTALLCIPAKERGLCRKTLQRGPRGIRSLSLKTVDFVYIAEETADLASATLAILQREIS